MNEFLLLVSVGLIAFIVGVAVAYVLKRHDISKKKKEIIAASERPKKRFGIDYDKLKESSSLRGPSTYHSSENSRRGGLSAIAHIAETLDEEKGDKN